MADAEEFFERFPFLAHYASEYYDPAKAREYYLKNRELKGRRSGSGLKSEKKKAAWEYAKDQIDVAKKADLDNARGETTNDIANVRAEATQHREAIGKYISALLKNISEKRQKESDKISDERTRKSEALSKAQKRKAERISKQAARKIASLPPIPKGITGEQRSKLVAERAKEIGKIRGEASKEHEILKKESSSERESLTTESKKARDTLSEKL